MIVIENRHLVDAKRIVFDQSLVKDQAEIKFFPKLLVIKFSKDDRGSWALIGIGNSA